MNYAYIRQMPDAKSISQQQKSILSFSLTQDLEIQKEVVEYSSKNHPLEERKQFEEFMRSLENGSKIFVDSLSVLSNHAEELIKIINCMLSRKSDLYVASSRTLINRDTTAVEIFPLLNDLREAQKAKPNQIGRPKGSRSHSKFDIYRTEIITLLKQGMNVSAIARELGVSRSSLKDYIESRGIKELVEGSWLEVVPTEDIIDIDSTILVCPLEKQNQEQRIQDARK
jgi:DNA invertase Pin-like site-specific DNA recombinase